MNPDLGMNVIPIEELAVKRREEKHVTWKK